MQPPNPLCDSGQYQAHTSCCLYRPCRPSRAFCANFLPPDIPERDIESGDTFKTILESSDEVVEAELGDPVANNVLCGQAEAGSGPGWTDQYWAWWAPRVFQVHRLGLSVREPGGHLETGGEQ